MLLLDWSFLVFLLLWLFKWDFYSLINVFKGRYSSTLDIKGRKNALLFLGYGNLFVDLVGIFFIIPCSHRSGLLLRFGLMVVQT